MMTIFLAILVLFIGIVFDDLFVGVLAAGLLLLIQRVRSLSTQVESLAFQVKNLSKQVFPVKDTVMVQAHKATFNKVDRVVAVAGQGQLSAYSAHEAEHWPREQATGEDAAFVSEALAKNIPAKKSSTWGAKASNKHIGLQPPSKTKSEPTLPRWCKALLLAVLGRFLPLIDKAIAFYTHYQRQGKAPVFLMTVAGITALVLGFGYFLQYSFTQYLPPLGKIAVGYGGAALVLVCGLFLHKKQPKMGEFASSLMALSIILAYLCGYFSGGYFHLMSDGLSFVALAVITAAAYYLALRFETRVVAIVSLVGGSLTPLIIADGATMPLIYLAYLWLLSALGMRLSYRILWPLLADIALFGSLAILEYLLWSFDALRLPPLVFTASLALALHAFYYLFMVYLWQQYRRLSGTPPALLLVQTTASAFFLIAGLNQVLLLMGMGLSGLDLLGFMTGKGMTGRDNVMPLGLVLMFNAVVAGVVFMWAIKPRSASHRTSTKGRHLPVVALLVAGLLLAAGILALASADFLAALWGVEGLTLLWLGFVYRYRGIRNEGLFIVFMALSYAGSDAVHWLMNAITAMPHVFQPIFNQEYWNLMAFVVLLGGTHYLLQRFNDNCLGFENHLKRSLALILPHCLVGASLATLALFWFEGFWLLSPVFAVCLMAYGYRKQQAHTQWAGLFQFIYLLFPLLFSALAVGNVHFEQQTWVAKLARGEVLMALWLIPFAIKRCLPDGPLSRVGGAMEKFFYLALPALLLPLIWRRYNEWFPLALWLAASLSLALALWRQQRVYFIAARGWLPLAGVITAVLLLANELGLWTGQALLAVVAGILVNLGAFVYWQGFKQTPVLNDLAYALYTRHEARIKPLFTTAVLYWGFALGAIIQGALGVAELSFLGVLAYGMVVLHWPPLGRPLRRRLAWLYCFNWLMVILLLAWACLLLSLSVKTVWLEASKHLVYLFSPLLAGYWLAYANSHPLSVVRRKVGGPVPYFYLQHLLLILTYVTLLNDGFPLYHNAMISVALVAHSTFMLFATLKPRYKALMPLVLSLFALAGGKILFFDLNGFSLLEKVMAFMAIGGLLLLAAFLYQKKKSALNV